MKIVRTSLTVLLLLLGFCASAKDVTDTLYSAKRDRIIVTYSITQKNNRVDVQFKSVRKTLGDYHPRGYYRETDKVSTLFFDWIGEREGVKFSGEPPLTIVYPAEARYSKSPDGYFIVEQNPKLSFELGPNGATSFSVPLYLVHYEGRNRYKIVCSYGNLRIQIPGSPGPSNDNGTVKKTTPQQAKSEPATNEEDEADTKLNEQALSLIETIMRSLPQQNALPLESTLDMQVKMLVELQPQIKDNTIKRRINETLDAYNGKKRELQEKSAAALKQEEDDKDFNNCIDKQDFERYVNQHPDGKHVEEAQNQINKLDNQAQETKKEERKRTIWMIIGGVLLAILLFVGNQVLQSFRNQRNQRNLMQMQKDATRRAESMARSKTQGAVSKQTRKVIGKAKQKGQTIIKTTKNNNTGNNRISI